jgi:hypothetical protein
MKPSDVRLKPNPQRHRTAMHFDKRDDVDSIDQKLPVNVILTVRGSTGWK